jgi:hypothetical protein
MHFDRPLGHQSRSVPLPQGVFTGPQNAVTTMRDAVCMPRACLFCGRTPVSSEHAVALWTGDVIPGSGPWMHGHRERHGDDPIREWSKSAPDLKCNVPCRACNNGWMSALEGRAKPVLTPMFQGSPRHLQPHELEVICFWAQKTSLMLDRCSDATRQNIPDAEFQELYVAQSALPSAHIWTGKCDVSRGSSFQARTVELDPGDARTIGYAATLCVGHLVFELISIKLTGPVKLGLKPDVLTHLAPIRPRGFKLDWPATPDLTWRQVADLGDRIADSGLRIYPA